MRWGVVVAAAVALLACAPSAFAAPKTTHAAAYEVMKKWMQTFDKDGFAKTVDYGGSKTYRVRLAQMRILVDPNLTAADGSHPIATYGPEPNTITFSKDPRKVKAKDVDALGETVWHEVTHALEDKNGDDFTNTDKLYQDRNTWYMAHVVKSALPWLDEMERRAKAGASVEQLRKYWEKYLKEMEAAAKLEETLKYPPDLELMRKWFGFRANPEEIKALYLSGKALPGKQGENLRKALTPAFKPADWAGLWDSWVGGVYYGGLTLTVSGTSVTGVWEYSGIGEQFQGTVSADGGTMTGTWLVDTNLWAGPEHYVKTFDVHLLNNPLGSWGFQGYMQSESDPNHVQTLFEAGRQ